MPAEPPRELESLLDDLRSRGFELIEDRSVPEFGDRAIVLEHPPLVVKLVGERGRWSVSVRGMDWEMGFSPDEWRALREERPLAESFSPLGEEAAYLLAHLDWFAAQARAASGDLEQRLRDQRSTYNRDSLGLDDD